MARDWSAVFDVEDPPDLFEHFQRETYRGRDYRYLPDARHGVERGTVIVDDVVVRGFPSIPRVLVLDPGIPEFFDGQLTVEEKLNGCNVRVAQMPPAEDDGAAPDDEPGPGDAAKNDAAIPDDERSRDAPFDGGPVAFTRSGHVCPYTTAAVDEMYPLDEYFGDHPESVLCGELIGPENPYTAYDYDDVESVAFRVFDVRERESGDPLPVADRRDRCAAYGFEQVESFGTYDPESAVDAVGDAIDSLDERGREGVVMTAADGQRRLKYTTSAAHRSDLEHGFSLPFDYGRDFLFARVLREAFQAAERDDSMAETRERARKLGEAVLLPAVETIRSVGTGEPVGEELRVRADPGVVERLFDQFREQGLELDVQTSEHRDDERVVEFVKTANSTRDKTAYYLDGGTIDE